MKNLKKFLCTLTIAALSVQVITVISASAADGDISTYDELKAALNNGGTYDQAADITISGTGNQIGITKSTTINGNSHTITSGITDGNATIYQNENVNSVFNALTIQGNTKSILGLWFGNGTAEFNNTTVTGYQINDWGNGNRYSAVAVAGSTVSFNNSTLKDNYQYDIDLETNAVVNLNKGTTLESVRYGQASAKLNIGADFDDDFKIVVSGTTGISIPDTGLVIGTIDKSADISGITAVQSGKDYSVIRTENNELVLIPLATASITTETAEGEGEYAGTYAVGHVVTISGAGAFKNITINATINNESKAYTYDASNDGITLASDAAAVYGFIWDKTFDSQPSASATVTLK